jgi:hypothetical protein
MEAVLREEADGFARALTGAPLVGCGVADVAELRVEDVVQQPCVPAQRLSRHACAC